MWTFIGGSVGFILSIIYVNIITQNLTVVGAGAGAGVGILLDFIMYGAVGIVGGGLIGIISETVRDIIRFFRAKKKNK